MEKSVVGQPMFNVDTDTVPEAWVLLYVDPTLGEFAFYYIPLRSHSLAGPESRAAERHATAKVTTKGASLSVY